MRLRSVVAVAIVLAASTPRAAHAEEIAADTPSWIGPVSPEEMRARIGLGTTPLWERSHAPFASPLTPSPEEIRLSHGAKTAIIVVAIVVGALIILGVIAVAGPGGHHL